MAPKKAGDDAHTASALLAKYGKTRDRKTKCTAGTHPRAALIMELLAGGMSPARISEVIAAEYGETLKPQPIYRHLRGECLCPR